MKNLSRWIIHHLFDSGAPPPHGITHFDKPQNPVLLLLLLLTAAATPYASAQTNQDSSFPDSSYGKFSPSMALVIVVLVCAFFFIGFFPIYLRKCLNETTGAENGNSLHSAALRLRTSIGLDPELIGSFPVFQYSEVKDLKIGKGSLECAVCITEFEDDETLRLLPKCDHVFHPECIDAWLASHTTCPVCRANLMPNPEDLAVKTGHVTESTQDDQNLSLENQNVNQISISVHEDERVRKLSRSHSTGHSLVQMRENCEKYTLRLPEAVRKQIMSRRLYRTASCVVFPTEGSSRRGYRTVGGDGSSRGRRSDRWGFQFFSRTRSVLSPKAGVDGDVTVVGNSRLFLTSVKTPFDCLALKGDGVDQMSTRPAV